MKTGKPIQAGLVCLLTTAALALSLAAAETRPKRAANQLFMRQKLMWSQAVLEGLALEKFDVVSANAIRMRDMTHSNQWFTLKQPDYVTRTTNFQKSVDALYMAAVDKNLEAATEAYTKVARNCVECHRLVRTAQRGNAGMPPPTGAAAPKPDLKPSLYP